MPRHTTVPPLIGLVALAVLGTVACYKEPTQGTVAPQPQGTDNGGMNSNVFRGMLQTLAKSETLHYRIKVSTPGRAEMHIEAYLRRPNHVAIWYETQFRFRLIRDGAVEWQMFPDLRVCVKRALDSGYDDPDLEFIAKTFFQARDYLADATFPRTSSVDVPIDGIPGIKCDVIEILEDVSGQRTQIWVNRATQLPARVKIFDFGGVVCDVQAIETTVTVDDDMFTFSPPADWKVTDFLSLPGHDRRSKAKTLLGRLGYVEGPEDKP